MVAVRAAAFPLVCVHELFEQQAARAPDATAVVFEDRQLSYRELNERANRVAHFLRRRGVGTEVLVGVSLERTPEMVIALLGVLKAGGAYVPLDPAYPKERVAFMAGDAAVRVMLTDEKSRPLLPPLGADAVCLDSEWALMARESASNLPAQASTSNLAYVMYTSGSTGKPKGAMIQHRGLANYVCWAIEFYALQAGSSVPLHTSISFDLTVTSLFPPLLAGGQVELLPEGAGAQHLVDALRRCGNRGLVKITPAHLELLGRQLASHEIAGMTRAFVIGGENLLAESLRFWRTNAPETRLINEYGPTETVVGCCVYEVQAADPHHGSVPIGRPISNTRLYVVDGDMKRVAAGEKGMLYVGGAGVARGYLNRPRLTQEKFVADPFSGEPGARLYATGDLVRCREDGTLEYLGRADDQVKIRGYRIEPAEIEQALSAHPAVQSCAVIAREDVPGNRQLVAYVVPRKSSWAAAGAMRDFLKHRLPDYMVPTQFAFLDALPLTRNGKVDRQGLSAPAREHSRESGAPRTPTEKALASLWSDLLHVENIGIHDDVFDLGAHSLLAINAVIRMRTMFQVDVSLRNLYESPTVAGLAGLIDASWLAAGRSALPVGGEDREDIAL